MAVLCRLDIEVGRTGNLRSLAALEERFDRCVVDQLAPQYSTWRQEFQIIERQDVRGVSFFCATIAVQSVADVIGGAHVTGRPSLKVPV